MLLMIDGPARAPRDKRRTHVAAGTAGSIEVLQGQLLEITALGAGAVASLFGFVNGEPSTFLSVHHTRVFSNSYLLGQGMRLVTNRRRALMVLGKDTAGTHDLLMPASTNAFLASIGRGDEVGCVESVQAELDRMGLAPVKLPDPVNLFMNVRLHTDGRLEPLPNRTQAGDRVVMRVLRDTTFIVSACCTGIAGNDRPAALQLSAAEDLTEL